jgi:tetratricopeptide (TPR) repeat protein
MLRSAAIVALLVVSLASGAARAGNPDKEARALFQRAEHSFNLGKFREALADYQAAYEQKPLSGFLFNIAQCYRNLGEPERARFFYRRYLTLEPHTPNRALVEDLITEMTRLLDQAARPEATPARPAAADSGKPPAFAPVATAAPYPPLRAAPPPAFESSPPSEASLSEAPASDRPVYKRWWFWTAIGAVAAASVVGVVLLGRNSDPSGTLQPIDGRRSP